MENINIVREEDAVLDFSMSSECSENDQYLSGPPFSPKDYMLSPSESDEVVTRESVINIRRKLHPSDLKSEENPFNARKALKKLRNLLEDKYGKNHIERQRNLVCCIVKGHISGFLMEDISMVTEIIEHFALNFKHVPAYLDMIGMILEVAMNPPRIMKSSDVLNCKKDFSNYFTMLGELLVAFDENTIQCRALEILTMLLARPIPADTTCTKLQYCHAAMEDSLLPYTIASMLETVSVKIYPKYLDVALHAALASRKACIIMIQSGAMEYILWRLDPNYGIREKHVAPVDEPYSDLNDYVTEGSDYYKVLDRVGHLMWNFLNTITDFKVNCQAPSQSALWSLRYALHAEAKKRSKKAVITRNSLAGIIVKLYAVFGEKLPILQSGLAVDVALLSVATEIGTKNTWAENITFGASKADFVLKKMMMLCCCELAKDESLSETLKEQKVIEGFLHLINPDLTALTVSWVPSQFFQLLFLALPILSELVPLLPEVYVSNKGNTRLLMALEWFMEEHFDNFPLLETLKTLCTLVSCKNSSIIIQDLKEQYGLKTILNICFYILESQCLKKDHQDKLTRIFLILEKLCKNERKVQACLGNMYVAVSIKFLRRAVTSCEGDSKVDSRLLICFSGFLWEAVVWCSTLLRTFTEQKGIYLLLDLVQMSSYPVQIMFLGLLVDMADEGETLTHLLTWRDKNGYGILNTMIKIWRKEEFLNKVPRTPAGCIADVERPLMSEEQWYLTYCVKNAHMFSPAIAEMFCNARPKIHSLYHMFRRRFGYVTDLNESLYSISFTVVQPHNQVYIPLIEHFLSLKFGEIWNEIYHDVILSGLVPSSCEGETLTKLLEQKNKWAYRLKTMQEEIMTLQKLNASDNEGKLYRLIRSSCLASALDALHELDYITRTSYKEIQITKKLNQLKEIEGSLKIPLGIDDTHIHRTAVRDTNVTYLCGKYVWFKSEREVLPQRSLVVPVSQSSSECDKLHDF